MKRRDHARPTQAPTALSARLEAQLGEAIARHQEGQLVRARELYENIIKAHPTNFVALHLLGIIAAQAKNYVLAVDLIGKAIAISPDNAVFHSNHGNALKELRQLDAAVESYNKAIRIKLDYADAYYNRGVALQQLKQLDAAVASYNKAIALRPDDADAYHNRANALKELGQLDAAVASYDKAVSINHNYAEAYYNRGVALQQLKQLDAAVASYDKAIRIKPDYADAHYNRGISLEDLNQPDAAVESYNKAIGIKPDYAEAYSNRGIALQELKQLDAAVESYNKAISVKPDYADAYGNRGAALQELKQLDAAVASYNKAISIKPDYAEAYYNRGVALQELKQLAASVESYNKAISIKPDYADAYSNRGSVLQELNQLVAAVESCEKALSITPDRPYLFGMVLLARMRMCDWQSFADDVATLLQKIDVNAKCSPSFSVLAISGSLPAQRKAAEIWVSDKYPYNPSLGSIPKPQAQKRIRIGYYSADFHAHATTHLMAGLFECHDRARFELVAFSFGPDSHDEMRNRVSAAFDQFIDVRMMTDKAVAELSRKLGIDIAVDLKGLTQDERLGIFSYRAAPIQVSYLGYPGTLGADYMDYLIADRTLIPEQSRQYYSENIAYLPNSYQVNDRKRAISEKHFTREEMGLPSERFVFCCFNNSYKITPSVFDGWVRIINSVEGSVLWLLEDNPTATVNLRKEAERRGLDATRLVFAKRMQPPEHLARHRLADLFLDTLPYNAHTTASDALWAGLPVLTCMGESFASRVAASILNAIFLPELITTSQQDYEALAIELGNNSATLRGIRDKLNRNRLSAPLFDTELFARNIEDLYTQMVALYRADSQPRQLYSRSLGGG